jgi:hypothetical protein
LIAFLEPGKSSIKIHLFLQRNQAITGLYLEFGKNKRGVENQNNF